jgi:hypothetical protein
VVGTPGRICREGQNQTNQVYRQEDDQGHGGDADDRSPVGVADGRQKEVQGDNDEKGDHQDKRDAKEPKNYGTKRHWVASLF